MIFRKKAPQPEPPQRLRWTPELVERFWTGVSQTRLVEHSFARQGGRGFIAAIAHLLPKDGRILDFGAGDGEIVELLCERGLRVAAYEPSSGRSHTLQDKLGKYAGFLGAVDMHSQEQFDLVMMIEVIEHVLDEQLHSTLGKLAKFTRVGGTLVISTPNNEDLDLSLCYCPVSNQLFHRWQHVRSFTRETLVALLAKYGFEEVVTHELEYNDALYVPYDDTGNSAARRGDIPSHMRYIRSNRPVKIANQANLLYVGRRLSHWEASVRDSELVTAAVELGQAVKLYWPRAWDSAKLKLKGISGRRYEPWLRRPYLMIVKPVVIRLAKAIKDPKVILPAVRRNGVALKLALYKLLRVWLPERYRRFAERAPVRAQLGLLALCAKPWMLPPRILLAPPLRWLIALSGRRYRQAFRRFGAALKVLPTEKNNSYKGVLLMIGTLGPGGAERQAMYTLVGLARRGIKSLALAAVYLQSETQRFYKPKLEVVSIPAFELNRDTSHDATPPLADLLTAVSLLPPDLADVADYTRTLLEQRPHTAHLWLDEVNVKGGLAAVAVGVPKIVLSARSLPPCNFALYKPYMREGYRWLVRQANVVTVSNSLAGARAYEHWLGLPRGHIKVIHNGFDFDEKRLAQCQDGRGAYRLRHGIPADALVVGTVSRLSEEKRPLLFADIAAQVHKILPDVHFLVAGDGPLREVLETRAAAPGMAGRLHILGQEPKPFEAMAAMDMFLLTSRAEGLPNVLIEAQALGVPVVSTRVGGAPETLIEGRTGWTLIDGDAAAAAAKIADLLRNTSVLEQTGMAAWEHVRRHFTLERMIEETLQVYAAGGRKDGERGYIQNEGELYGE